MKQKRIPSNLFIILAVIGLVVILSLLRYSDAAEDLPLPTATPMVLGDYAGYEIVNRYPHDADCYTQGLFYLDGYLYESCGLYGKSDLRKVAFEDGQILEQVDLESQFFAEGLTHLDGLLYQLTWQEGTAFVYNLEDFEPLGRFSYSTEGWGLTTDGAALILSDGSNKLFWLDPSTGFSLKETHVTWKEHPIEYLNELEYVNGEIFANIYLSDQIARIDPETGVVLTMLDLSGLRPAENTEVQGEVLNGIAYDEAGDRLFVTGKNWPWLYEIQLIPIEEPAPSL